MPLRMELMAQGPEDQTTENSFFPPGLCLLRLFLLALQWPLHWAGWAPREWEGGRIDARWGMRAEGREPVHLTSQAQGW